MGKVQVHHYEAFSKVPNRGNPAGVVLEAEGLTDEQMQEAARKVGFNETAFPLPSDRADVRIRYFTPGHEINLCGHATMAALYALWTSGRLNGRTSLTIETKAGILPVRLELDNDELSITMRQAAPQFQAFNGSLAMLAEAMGLKADDIETELPTVYGSTGTWTLLVPVRGLEPFRRMKPENSRFPAILQEMPGASVHPFCLEAYDAGAHMHARHFSSPYSGTVEDPVTGTASGVMGAYYRAFIGLTGADSPLHLVIEQGQELGRDGRVYVTVEDEDVVEVTGQAVYVGKLEVSV